MDPEIPRLRPDAKPSDRPVQGKDDPVFIKRKFQGGSKNERTTALYSIDIQSIARKNRFIP